GRAGELLEERPGRDRAVALVDPRAQHGLAHEHEHLLADLDDAFAPREFLPCARKLQGEGAQRRLRLLRFAIHRPGALFHGRYSRDDYHLARNLKRRLQMAIAKASAQWKGTLKEGSGTMKGANGFFETPFTFKSRFEGDTKGTNPEELIGAASAGCFSMFLSAQLTNAGKPPTTIDTSATVHLGD